MSGHWDRALPTKKFQGIGKTTRDAKFKSAQAALNKLVGSMPGLGVEGGELPEEWLQWAHENLEKGVPDTTVENALTHIENDNSSFD